MYPGGSFLGDAFDTGSDVLPGGWTGFDSTAQDIKNRFILFIIIGFCLWNGTGFLEFNTFVDQ